MEVEIPETQMVDAPVVEAPVVETVEDALEVATDVVVEGEPAEEGGEGGDIPEEVPEEAPVEKPAEEVAEPVTFDHTAEDFGTKIDETLEKYDLAEQPELQALITALRTKADTPQEAFAPYREYAPEDASNETVVSTIKTLLDHRALLESVDEVAPGAFRPKTAEFIAEIHDPVVKEWMLHDLNQQPSDKYRGLNKFQETIADTFGKEGESVTGILDRYAATVAHMQLGTVPTLDGPSFVPNEVREAYLQLPQSIREEFALLDDPLNDEILYDNDGRQVKNVSDSVRADKVRQLALIQEGLNASKAEAVRSAQARQQGDQLFAQDVDSTEMRFYNSFRETFAKNINEEVKFSDDPKMQQLLATQNVSLMAQALEEGAAGEFARKSLEVAGIKLDYVKAQSLAREVHEASVKLVTQERMKGADGQPMNPILLQKAKSAFAEVGLKFQLMAKEVIDQQARLVSTGKAEDVEKAVEKKKIALKARPVAKSTPSKSVKADTSFSKHPWGTPEYYADYANAVRAEERVGAR